MNYSYRLTWDESTRRCLPAPETARRQDKGSDCEAMDLKARLEGLCKTLDEAFTSLAMLLTGVSSDPWRR
ncbi:hypothetical protein [Variovorax fucosicus]|uniref:hypothetical protein n=1 Tax=Variovorax fucosicus TaxID=3053517 RepID=UPI002577CC16|nr:hypothetical protein [Variovorax sp. J22G47]MDM0054713.1 hypothetical protein [Variovorax sp. J22G47]